MERRTFVTHNKAVHRHCASECSHCATCALRESNHVSTSSRKEPHRHRERFSLWITLLLATPLAGTRYAAAWSSISTQHHSFSLGQAPLQHAFDCHAGKHNPLLSLTRLPLRSAERNLRSAREIFDADAGVPSSISTSKKRKKARTLSRGRKTVPSKKKGNAIQTWRVFGVEVHPDLLDETVTSPRGGTRVPVDQLYLCKPVLDALLSRLRIKSDSWEPVDVRVVRRSLDARRKRRQGDKSVGPRYNYVLDVDLRTRIAEKLRLKHQPGRLELLSSSSFSSSSSTAELASQSGEGYASTIDKTSGPKKPRVIVVGAGPAGLFCALTLARSGRCTPVVLERGQPVESRGKDIGALIHRRSINTESNFAFGEGGAGTWSDGKLTTRIGRNSDAVRFVLETLVEYGAPEKILVDGAPHLGTDNLVKLLRNMRRDLRNAGGEIRFGAKMTRLHQQDGAVSGVDAIYSGAVERGSDEVGKNNAHEGSETINGEAVVLATGHSARDVYEKLHSSGVQLEAKGFAVGFRVEHPQRVINKIQYGAEWGKTVVTGRGATDAVNKQQFETAPKGVRTDHDASRLGKEHPGRLPVASYRLATDKAFDGTSTRGVYSFCMCPGGQIVPASTDPNEVCVNGMSFSKRDSLWANSALVVTVSPDDPVLATYREEHDVLAGVAFQRDMERRASLLGGGNLTVPVQRLTDFVDRKDSTSAPTSSYRLGVKPAACHEIYPLPLVNALRDAVVNFFEKQMPGFLCEEGLLHGVETRTSSPVRVSRDSVTMQAIGVKRLFPAGEGAGFAGGIVSAAVDGLMVAEAVLEELSGKEKETGVGRKRLKSVGFDY